jgi:hypothetical protein
MNIIKPLPRGISASLSSSGLEILDGDGTKMVWSCVPEVVDRAAAAEFPRNRGGPRVPPGENEALKENMGGKKG